jgi:ubiquinone/menaquinone biosynthesis C-methylase UbiE
MRNKKRSVQRHKYFMETINEGARLHIKTNTSRDYDQLKLLGLHKLTRNPTIIDAGSGSGAVSQVMAKIMTRAYTASRLILVDGSGVRLREARDHLKRHENIKYKFVEAELNSIPIKTATADFVFCRFVFEYLQDPKSVLSELIRILKPGGRLVVGDLDYNCMTHYPIDPQLEQNLHEILKVLEKQKFIDPFVGRKLYTWFYEAGLKSIRVNLAAHHLFYGSLPKSDDFNWKAKFDQVSKQHIEGKLELSFCPKKFSLKIMEFLRKPERFSYTPLILVEGTKE